MKQTYAITTQKALRAAFWDQDGVLADHYKASYRQNQYSSTVRCDWVDFVDAMQRNGTISEALAFRATL